MERFGETQLFGKLIFRFLEVKSLFPNKRFRHSSQFWTLSTRHNSVYVPLLAELAVDNCGWTSGQSKMKFSVLLFLFLWREKCYSAETVKENNSPNSSNGNSLQRRKHPKSLPNPQIPCNESIFPCDASLLPASGETAIQSNSSADNNVTNFREDYKYWVDGFLLAIVSFVGILGNIASWLKFARQRTQKLFHYLLLGLATFDMVSIFIISYIIIIMVF